MPDDDDTKPAPWPDDEVSTTTTTGSPAETLHKINERSKLSSVAALKTLNAATTTLDRVEDVRKELTGHIRDVDEKVDSVIIVVGDLRVAHENVATKLDGIATTLHEDRELRQKHQHLRAAAEVEVDKTSKIADIEVSKTDRLAIIGEKTKWGDTWRGLVLKVAGGIGVIISAYAAGKGC